MPGRIRGMRRRRRIHPTRRLFRGLNLRGHRQRRTGILRFPTMPRFRRRNLRPLSFRPARGFDVDMATRFAAFCVQCLGATPTVAGQRRGSFGDLSQYQHGIRTSVEQGGGLRSRAGSARVTYRTPGHVAIDMPPMVRRRQRRRHALRILVRSLLGLTPVWMLLVIILGFYITYHYWGNQMGFPMLTYRNGSWYYPNNMSLVPNRPPRQEMFDVWWDNFARRFGRR